MLNVVKVLRWKAYHLWLNLKMKRVRKHRKIRFLFILQELSQWKTETLYKAMLAHPRFEPILGVTKCLGYRGAEAGVIEYCKEKGYEYVWLDPDKPISEQIQVDLLTHQKPYLQEINPAHFINANRSIPTVYIPYYLGTITEEWVVNSRMAYLAWRQFLDFKSNLEEWKRISRVQGCNYCLSGLPIMDELLTPKSSWEDVWPVHDHRKRIIYAPHHTIADRHWVGIGYSTFLEFGQFLLDMRDKYRDQVFFVFKPHPHLFDSLVSYCGEEKARAYFDAWKKPGCSHIEVNDKYIPLFKYSDAMIHDCGSFTIEYLYMGKPVMYLVRDEHHKDNMTGTSSRAFDLHYKGFTKEDIEGFIQDVIAGNDPRAGERKEFLEQELLPPYGKTACENIINEILGEKQA